MVLPHCWHFSGASTHLHHVTGAILLAGEGGILPRGSAPEWRRTAMPPGKMPGSTAGRMPAATRQSGGGNEMRPRFSGLGLIAWIASCLF